MKIIKGKTARRSKRLSISHVLESLRSFRSLDYVKDTLFIFATNPISKRCKLNCCAPWAKQSHAWVMLNSPTASKDGSCWSINQLSRSNHVHLCNAPTEQNPRYSHLLRRRLIVLPPLSRRHQCPTCKERSSVKVSVSCPWRTWEISIYNQVTSPIEFIFMLPNVYDN